MSIYMAGIDFSKASIDYRERFALTTSAQAMLLKTVLHRAGVSGGVVISTCNRMELWLSGELPAQGPFELLCQFIGVDAQEYEQFFTRRKGSEAIRHLFELASGLKSQILGEEQILTQVREAIGFARNIKSSDPVLEALFRRAVTAAKKAKSSVRLISVDRSASQTAIRILRDRFGSLKNLKCLIIGSGEMGRLAAKELVAEGCDVTMTLRQYKSGEAVVPTGCHVIDYEDRFKLLASSKVIISATRSPHFTLHHDQVKDALSGGEKLLFDMAVPRDIDPTIAGLPNVILLDIDHLGGNLTQDADNEGVQMVRAIIDKEIQEFERWNSVRALMPKISEISATASADVEGRIRNSLRNVTLDDSCKRLIHDAAGKAVSKVVENILLSLQKEDNGALLTDFLLEMEKGSPKEELPAPLPPRFPLFVDLSGKNIAVIGAGTIALRRISALCAYPCDIRVIAPEAREEIRQLDSENKIVYVQKEYDPSDLHGAYLVVAATDKRALNHKIALDAGKNGQYCSISDCKEECTFYFPATVHYGGGVIGICGTGENHAKTREMTSEIREFIKARDNA